MSATLTGVCGLSWEVTMAVLPRLYAEEVLSELQRRKIAVRKQGVNPAELTQLLQEVMKCEYKQLQQLVQESTRINHSPPTRMQDGQATQHIHNQQRNLPGMTPVENAAAGVSVHGSSFTNGQTDRLLMQVSPQTQTCPQIVQPQVVQGGSLRKRLADTPRLPKVPPQVVPVRVSPYGGSPSGILGIQGSPQSSPPQLVRELLLRSRASNQARQVQPEVLPAQRLQQGVVANSSHGNPTGGSLQSSPNQVVQQTSPKTAPQLSSQSQHPAMGAKNASALNSRMPANMQTENICRDSASVTTAPSNTLQENMQRNMSPHIVGQVNAATEAGNKKPHQDVQGMSSTSTSDPRPEVSCQGRAQDVEQENESMISADTGNTPTQVRLRSIPTASEHNQTEQPMPENFRHTADHDSATQLALERDLIQSTQERISPKQDSNKNTNGLPLNVTVKIEKDDDRDFGLVPCMASAAPHDGGLDNVTNLPTPGIVVKTEKDDSFEASPTLSVASSSPLDYSVRSSMVERTAREGDISDVRRDERLPYASPEQSQASASTLLQQTTCQIPSAHKRAFQQAMSQVLSVHKQPSNSTSSASAASVPTLTLPLSTPSTIADTMSQENGYGFDVSQSGISPYDRTYRRKQEKRKTVRALLEEIKAAKQQKTGRNNADEPSGAVIASWQELGNSHGQSDSRLDIGAVVPKTVAEILDQQQRTGNMQAQGEDGLTSQFTWAATETDSAVVSSRAIVHSCTVCSFETLSATTLQSHLLTHSGERAHKCPKCPSTFNAKSSLLSHQRVHMGDDNVYRCRQCNFSASMKITLDNHLATHHCEELPYMCGVCGYRTSVKHNLSRHMRLVHGAEGSFQCPLCDYSSNNNSRLETHMIKNHF